MTSVLIGMPMRGERRGCLSSAYASACATMLCALPCKLLLLRCRFGCQPAYGAWRTTYGPPRRLRPGMAAPGTGDCEGAALMLGPGRRMEGATVTMVLISVVGLSAYAAMSSWMHALAGARGDR